MEKYLKRLCRAILSGRFNDEKYTQRKSWNGKDIQAMPLFCSYGLIGFIVIVYYDDSRQFHITWDREMRNLAINGTNWEEYINNL